MLTKIFRIGRWGLGIIACKCIYIGMNRTIQCVMTHKSTDVSVCNREGMFFPCKKSDILVVGFQACNDAGPRYNQVRTLKECGVNRLLIKDDFGPRQLGVYYLGCKENHAVETAVFELIDRCIAESRTLFKYIVFSGSSKGGYAALNFGIHYPNSVMVVAAPQYFLGNYLDSEKFRPTLEEILGGPVTEKNKNALNHRLKQRIREDTAAKTQRVYIHYSDKEHTYEEHIRALLEDLTAAGVEVHTDVKHYPTHEELKYFFPEYLSSVLEQLKKE